MKYSIIIPVFNAELSLRSTVFSIQNSGISDYEIILIDDGSKDSSPALCDLLADTYPNIRCIHQKNGGVSAARNRGIEEALGDYIWFVDADDRIRKINPQMLETYADASFDTMIFGMTFQYFKDEKLIKEETLSSDEVMVFHGDQLSDSFETLFNLNYFSACWNKLVSRRLLLDYGIRFNPQLTNYEDLEFSLQVLSYCASFAALPEVWYEYRNEWATDHTVERLSRIEHVVDNTDLIAKAFFDVAEKHPEDLKLQEQIAAITLRIYLELCYQKLQTCRLPEIETLCSDFQKNSYIAKCSTKLNEMAGTYQTIYAMLQEGNAKKIRDYMRYRKARHAAGAVARAVLGRR